MTPIARVPGKAGPSGWVENDICAYCQLEVLQARKHRFDVNNGRTVDGFDRADSQAILDNPAHGDAIEGPADLAGQEIASRVSGRSRFDRGMNFQHVAPSAVQPSHHDDVVAHWESTSTIFSCVIVLPPVLAGGAVLP
jgi:hypothetical protein